MNNEKIGERDISPRPPYRLAQAGVTINVPVPDFEGLVTHHPGDNRGARIVNGLVVGGQQNRTQGLGGRGSSRGRGKDAGKYVWPGAGPGIA